MKAMNLEPYLDAALAEARHSLRQGNSGFGAVVVKKGAIIAAAHDTDRTSLDPTAHAEINAIRQASKTLPEGLGDCMLVATHEPCPMCSTALVWAGIKQLAYGYSIKESIRQGRKRIDLGCEELFSRAGADIEVIQGVKREECSVLYNGQVRKSLKQLRNFDAGRLRRLCGEMRQKRLDWFARQEIAQAPEDWLQAAYELFFEKAGYRARGSAGGAAGKRPLGRTFKELLPHPGSL
jgi:tRNA(adenine34) deaminase